MQVVGKSIAPMGERAKLVGQTGVGMVQRFQCGQRHQEGKSNTGIQDMFVFSRWNVQWASKKLKKGMLWRWISLRSEVR
jgi:hypothetical protein